jgi:hypothetical protein
MTFFDNSGVAGTRLQHESGSYLNSNLDVVPTGNSDDLYWKLIDLGNGFHRIESQDNSKAKIRLQALDNGVVRMTGQSSDWHLTQWEKIPVASTNDQYYLKNRYYGTHLRVGISDSTLKHGAIGRAAHWTLKSETACKQ